MRKLIIILVFVAFTSPCWAQDYILPDEVRKAIISYLIKQPYEEVAAGVQALMTLKEIPPPVEDKKSEPKK
jgi:hypothetical protein